MASKDHGPSIKDDDTYEALRDDGASKQKAARIANAQANDSQHPSAKGGKAPPYEEWTKSDLYERAQELGIEGRSSMSKADLITAMRNS
ncbi:Rho termination factor N-terminal domain-containing protein [Hoeflea sp. YIM 152468]|uniref:DUF7218 family protein n=1 Tax=Hoeflea sp. YIM 152468 TaxID=3031759 RepID=UPI0023DBC3CC|nr:Rho termination factor N-terminal domain-containing protein [Hoeflea sp. YIM 152468]MDF1609500.1 Rho termination factor N-terminal domain-containing protein [Hoeflea sp. YIM 152468]